jgi:hypothetical protein
MNCFLKHIIEGKTGGMRRRGRRSKQLLGEVKAKRRYLSLEEEELDRAFWRSRFGRRCGPVGNTARTVDMGNRP